MRKLGKWTANLLLFVKTVSWHDFNVSKRHYATAMSWATTAEVVQGGGGITIQPTLEHGWCWKGLIILTYCLPCLNPFRQRLRWIAFRLARTCLGRVRERVFLVLYWPSVSPPLHPWKIMTSQVRGFKNSFFPLKLVLLCGAQMIGGQMASLLQQMEHLFYECPCCPGEVKPCLY